MMADPATARKAARSSTPNEIHKKTPLVEECGGPVSGTVDLALLALLALLLLVAPSSDWSDGANSPLRVRLRMLPSLVLVILVALVALVVRSASSSSSGSSPLRDPMRKSTGHTAHRQKAAATHMAARRCASSRNTSMAEMAPAKIR